MRNLVTALPVFLLFAGSGSWADDAPSLSFLKPGHDYVLRFAGKSPFEQTQGIPIEPQSRKPRASITSASITYSITVFTVVELSGDSWVLVEHPKSIKQAFKWNFKRLALAALNPETIAMLEASDDGRDKLETLRQQASVEFETEQTWVNLAHVVAIARPPSEPQDFRLNMQVQRKD